MTGTAFPEGHDPKSGTPPPRMSRGLRVVLFLSLAMNLAVVGIVCGALLSGGSHGRPPGHVVSVVAPYTGALTRESRREIWRELRDTSRRANGRDAWRGLRDRMRADYREALSLLRADQFDADAFGAIVSRQAAQAQAWQSRGQEAFIAHLDTMSLGDRRAYADRVEVEIERMRRRKSPRARDSR